ncbi:uncharacterized protein LOC111411468 [Olea europaea var. sylvestris]|uniref:uncharacterized protein LOC111411468 n=1 Tax=Olea europaea var. sylvestris TaxID=158386 RepID=UPI000C1D1139|nr:uncharacterized protein LOC111411468 [Olea europaea var. sylvestris]
MSTRKSESGYSKRKWHKKVEQLIKSHEGAIDKFFYGNKQKHNDDIVPEEEFDKNDIDDNTIEKHHCLVNEEISIEDDVMNERNINEKISEPFSFDISDPANLKNVNLNLRDLIIMKGPVRDNDVIFPKDVANRHFSSVHYTRRLSNGENHDRKWLIYSKSLDKIFSFSCKLFKNNGVQTQLAHDGANDWKNIENNLAFRGDNEKIYQENNGIFLSLIQMIAEFDPNELILMLAGEIKKMIIEKLKESKYFSVILDCTLDLSHEEQMSIVLRCVDISASPVKIEEFFLGFLLVDDTSGKGLFDELVNALNNLELDINNIRDQGYDNDNVNGLILKPLSQTRWKSHVESVRTIRFQALQIRNALLELARVDDPKTKSEAEVSKYLQIEDIHIDVAIDHLKGLISFFKSYRETRFESAVIDAKEIANELDIELIFREKRVICRKKHSDEISCEEMIETVEESFRDIIDYPNHYCLR